MSFMSPALAVRFFTTSAVLLQILFHYRIIGYYKILNLFPCAMGFPGCSVIKNLPAVQEPQEMQIRSLSQEDPLEEVMATHSSILAWRVPRTEEPGRLWSIGS